jgi:hypothetical protein
MQALSLMRGALPALLILAFVSGCGGRTLTKKSAHSAIIRSTGDIFRDQDVDVKSVSQTSGDQGVVQADVLAAFTLGKADGEWKVESVRLGDHSWEKLEEILAALQEIKVRETRELLQGVASALEDYVRKNGALPGFTDYVSLSDALSPAYMTPLIRLDAWRNPLAAYHAGPDAVRLVSAGPDGKFGTADDIELTRSFRR